VPPLFSENFDYQSLRGDFVPGILTSDLLDSKIFMHVCGSSSGAAAGPSVQKNGYGARASSTRAYDAITRDVLAGAAHPLVPSSNIWPGERLEKRGRALVGAGVALDE
jgi:translation initiation factor eIF-2B subunit epsilon